MSHVNPVLPNDGDSGWGDTLNAAIQQIVNQGNAHDDLIGSLGSGSGTGGSTPSATTSTQGVVQLAGDLTGTASAPILKSIVAAGSAGSTSTIPMISWDAKGRITGVSSAPVATGGSTGGGSSSSTSQVATFFVDSYRQASDPDDTLAFSRAWSAAGAAGQGILSLSAKTYTVTALPTFTPPVGVRTMPYAIQGPGASVCVIKHNGTSAGSSLKVWDPNFDAGDATVGSLPWRGFSLDGSGSSGGTCGLIWSDISYPSFDDIDIHDFSTGDGWQFPNTYGWTEGVRMGRTSSGSNLAQIHFGVGVGQKLGTLTTTLNAGTSYSSLTFAGGLTRGVFSGQSFVIYTPNAVRSETVTATANANVGATTIPVQAFTPSQSYAANTAGAYVGSYGSFDYWNVEALYLVAGPNQSGIVSDVPRGTNGVIDRVGSTWRVTGNFIRAGSTNTGAFMWLKGPDRWGETFFDIAAEIDGDGNSPQHQAIRLDDTGSYLQGTGRIFLYYFAPGPVVGGLYQFGLSGRMCIAGVYGDGTDSVTISGGNRGVTGAVGPDSYPGSVSLATPWQNNTGADVFVTVPVRFTGNGTAGWNVDIWSGLPSALTAGIVQAAAPASGYTIPLTFIHYANMWARVDGTACTLGTPVARFA